VELGLAGGGEQNPDGEKTKSVKSSGSHEGVNSIGYFDGGADFHLFVNLRGDVGGQADAAV
jgi:hypothetical protein